MPTYDNVKQNTLRATFNSFRSIYVLYYTEYIKHFRKLGILYHLVKPIIIEFVFRAGSIKNSVATATTTCTANHHGIAVNFKQP